MSDAWSEAHDRALRASWCAEIARAMGGAPADETKRLMIASVVLSRSLLLDLDALAHGRPLEPGNLIRVMQAGCFVRMATYLRALGLTREDVRRLDLGRRRGRRRARATRR